MLQKHSNHGNKQELAEFFICASPVLLSQSLMCRLIKSVYRLGHQTFKGTNPKLHLCCWVSIKINFKAPNKVLWGTNTEVQVLVPVLDEYIYLYVFWVKDFPLRLDPLSFCGSSDLFEVFNSIDTRGNEWIEGDQYEFHWLLASAESSVKINDWESTYCTINTKMRTNIEICSQKQQF